MQTIEAAEALLNMDSPGPMLDEKRASEFERNKSDQYVFYVKATIE